MRTITNYNNIMKFSLFVSLIFVIVMTACTNFTNTTTANYKGVLKAEFPNMFGRGSEIRGPLTIEEIESESFGMILSCTNCPEVPFGYLNESWEEFKSSVQDGDVIVHFRTDTASWNALAGREGFALIRDDMLVKKIIVIMN